MEDPQYVGTDRAGHSSPAAIVLAANNEDLVIGGVRMAYLALGAFIVLVVGLTWLSSRRRQRSTGCCTPADPKDDLRMRAAFDEDINGPQPGPPTQ